MLNKKIMLNELSKQAYQNAKDKGFYESQIEMGTRLALIHSEVSEALEADRKNKFASKDRNLQDMDISDLSDVQTKLYFRQEFEVSIKDTFEDELADIMIRVMDLAAFKGIDLEYHIKMKMAYNSTRDYKHGKSY